MAIITSYTTIVVTSVVVILPVLYYAILPKPIPGIPYNHRARYLPLGDFPALARYLGKHHEPFTFFASQPQALSSPIVQLFLSPFTGRPTVIVSNYREAEDTLLRRGAEFDLSHSTSDVFGGIIPHATAGMVTTEQCKAQKRVAQEVMTPASLRDVVMPKVYDSGSNLIQLWKVKVDLANAKAFEAEEDLFRTVFDGVWHAVFGEDLGVVKKHIEFLTNPRKQASLYIVMIMT